jgi:hypothetical protein
VWFKIVKGIESIRIIAVSHSIRELSRLRKKYGKGRWRKLKGITTVELPNGEWHDVEIHWHEAHGIGRKEIKIKRFL